MRVSRSGGVRGAAGLACSCCLFVAALRAAPAGIADEYTLRQWGVEDGLPEGTVTSVARFPDGFLWLTTPRHVVRFDGAEFLAVPQTAFPPAKPRRLNALVRDADGAVWVSGENGVMRFSGRGWEAVPLEGDVALPAAATRAVETPDGVIERPAGLAVFWIKAGLDGALWVATSAGMYRHDGRAFALVERAGGAAAGDFLWADMDASGTVWLVDGTGLCAFDGRSYARRAFPTSGEKGRLFQVFAGRGSRLWAKRLDGKLFRGDGDQWEEIPPGGLRQTALVEEEDGDVWVGNAAGLHRWRQGRWSALSVSGPVRRAEVRCLVAAEDGSLWAGTGNGLLELRPRVVRMYPCVKIRPESVTALWPKGGGEFWVGTTDRGLLEGSPSKPLAPVGTNLWQAREGTVSALLAARDGTLWVGTQRDHLWSLSQSGAVRQTRTLAGLASRDITSLHEDRSGRLWVGTREGLQSLDRKGWLVAAGGPEDAVLALCDDGEGGLWAGYQSCGVQRRSEAGQWRAWGAADGLPSESVRALHRDGGGTLWVATSKGLAALSCSPQVSVRPYARGQGLPDPDLRQMVDDGRGGLWLGARDTIMRLDMRELAEVAAGRKAVVSPRVFGGSSGLGGELTSGGYGGPLAVCAEHGQLWFATAQGLAMIDTEALGSVGSPPPVYLEGIWAGGEPLQWGGSLPQRAPLEPAGSGQGGAAAEVLPAGTQSLAFRYTAPCFDAPEHVRFRTRLEGYESDWSMPTAERVRSFPSLPAGDYRFRVAVSGSSGGWREAAEGVRFTVRPFFWQTAWFVVLASSLALGAAGASGGLWVRRRARRRLEAARRAAAEREQVLSRERAVERERARIARDIHDDLGAGLTQMALLAELAQAQPQQPEQLRARLERIFQTASGLAKGLNEIVWAVNPKNDTLDSMVAYLGDYADDYLRSAKLAFRLALPGDLPEAAVTSAVRHHLFCATREALHNIVKHAGPCEVTLKAALDGGAIEIEVADTGRGFEPASACAAGGRRNGLANMRRRMEESGGRFEVLSAPGRGTAVRLRVELRPNERAGAQPGSAQEVHGP